MDVLIVCLPRGRTAVVEFEPKLGQVRTSDPGLRQLLRQGIAGWERGLVFPRDGLPFLSALYDRLVLNGYGVRWVSATRQKDEAYPCAWGGGR